MKLFLILILVAVNALAQNSDQILANSSNYARQEQPTSSAVFDTKILSGGLLSLFEHGNQVWSLASFREFNIVRRPGLERAMTLWGAANNTDAYVEPLFIEHGTLSPTTKINWDSAITIQSPRNPQNITGQLQGVWIEDQNVTGGGIGRAMWYNGNTFQWSVEGDGSSWIYTSSPYVNGNWSRFGMWCESADECYISSQSANAGIAPVIAISGPLLNIETDEVEVDDTPTFTGTCPSGTNPVFLKGLAVGCQ